MFFGKEQYETLSKQIEGQSFDPITHDAIFSQIIGQERHWCVQGYGLGPILSSIFGNLQRVLSSLINFEYFKTMQWTTRARSDPIKISGRGAEKKQKTSEKELKKTEKKWRGI